jgi:hypothetical protein
MRYVTLALMLSAITHATCQEPEPYQTANIVVWVHSVERIASQSPLPNGFYKEPMGFLEPHENEWYGKYNDIPERSGDPNDIIEALEVTWQNDMKITTPKSP